MISFSFLNSLQAQEVSSEVISDSRTPFRIALKTNLLYDALLVPNVGAECYLGRDWSVSANGMLAWWSKDSKQHYWRIYGGEVELRKWFGSKAETKPLTGHHLGIYTQIIAYDFELGGKGYMADPWNYTVGISYGYSHPIARRLNLDFTIGIGYMGGEYKKYKPVDDCYVWQYTKQRHWIGPTKAEVTLVWLLGKDNYNKEKGGKR